ncbi:MAG: TIGR04150 pseudo-rSAM protein [Tannerellaceae bacterium]
MKYFFYLEPYSFLFRNKNKAVIYNTLNSAYIVCPKNELVQDILAKWEDSTNGYGIVLDDFLLQDEILKQFVDDIRHFFSGDCVPIRDESIRPYIFKPTLYLNTDIRFKEENNKTFLGDRILQNLHEMNLFFPSTCTRNCAYCTSYYKQIYHCTAFTVSGLSLDDYIGLLNQLHMSGIHKINISAGGDPIQNSYIQNLEVYFTKSIIKKHLYVDFDFFNEEYLEFAQRANFIIEVLVHSEQVNSHLKIKMLKYNCDIVRWNLIVISEDILVQLNYLNLPEDISIQLIPFYTTENNLFFRDFVYSDLQDILAIPIDRKTLFRRKVLNDNFFGKLSLFPSGMVFSNVNCTSLGNIKHSSIKELVYKELTDRDTWLKVRGKVEPCKDCINKELCPSISNYELVIGKNNLCKIHSEYE